MATRLYPNTRSHAILEILAGVPAGTTSQLKEINARDLDWFGEPAQVAALAVGLSEANKDDPSCLPQTAETHLLTLRSEFILSPEYVRYLYKKTFLWDAFVLEEFAVYGWGPVQACSAWLAASGAGNTDYSGSVVDLHKVFYLLDTQNIEGQRYYRQDPSCWTGHPRNTRLESRTGSMFLSEIEGLHWR